MAFIIAVNGIVSLLLIGGLTGLFWFSHRSAGVLGSDGDDGGSGVAPLDDLPPLPGGPAGGLDLPVSARGLERESDLARSV